MASEQFPDPRPYIPGTWSSPAGPVAPGSWVIHMDTNNPGLFGAPPQLQVPMDVWRHVFRAELWILPAAGFPGEHDFFVNDIDPTPAPTNAKICEARLETMSAQITAPGPLVHVTNAGTPASKYILQPGQTLWFTKSVPDPTSTWEMHWRQWYVDLPQPLASWA